MQYINRHSQHGAALIVSLMMLMVMAIIGVSGLANTNLEERMAQNFQHTTIAFQAAESAIGKIVIAGDPGGTESNDNPFYDETTDPLLQSLDAGVDDTSTVVTYDMDPDGHLANTDVSADATIVYKNDGYCRGMSIGDVICYYFDVTSVATISATNTQQTHVQGVGRAAPNPHNS